MDVLPAKLGPAHRLRKIKDSQPIAPSFPRGSRNYGNIEIENDPSDEEEDSGFFEESSFGKVYKLPEQGLKLDFIAKYVASNVKTNGKLTSITGSNNKAEAWNVIVES